jgi:hypothetical protein
VREINEQSDLLTEYRRQRQHFEEEKPEWLYVDGSSSSGSLYSTFNYFPAAHYEKSIEELSSELRADGGPLHTGRTRSKLCYWVDPDSDSALVHTEVGEEHAIPFFDSVGEAEQYLEKRAETGDEERYENLSLYRARVKKQEDAVDVLLDQSGIQDFAADGGQIEGDTLE